MKTILYATDCSKTTKTALNHAYEFSLAMNAELHILHVYDLFPIVTSAVRSRSSLEKNYHNERLALLKRYCMKYTNENVANKFRYHLEKSDTKSKAILDTAIKIDADLVIIGHKDDNLFNLILTENIANRVMDALSCPLLIIPNELSFHGLSTILYATDFEESDIFAIEYLIDMIKPFGAQIKVIHIPRKAEYDVERKMHWFKTMILNRTDYPELVFSMNTSEDVESGIHEYIRQDMPQMLVMMERQRESFFENLFHKNMVKTMEDEIAIPLLVFNKNHANLKPQERLVGSLILSDLRPS